MTEFEETLNWIKEQSEQVKAVYEIDYNIEGLSTVEFVVEESRDHYNSLDEERLYNFSGAIGCFLGVCIEKIHGGKWEMSDEQIAIKCGKLVCFPFTKAWKFMQKDANDNDSLTAYFKSISELK